MNPDIIVVDSIQTMQSPLIETGAGSVSQVRQCTSEFMKYAKETDTPTFMIGHITKDGSLRRAQGTRTHGGHGAAI